LIKFRDGSGIYVSRSLTNADQLAKILQHKCQNSQAPSLVEIER
jgi:hypothetical protein